MYNYVVELTDTLCVACLSFLVSDPAVMHSCMVQPRSIAADDGKVTWIATVS